jgi:hypothetical protein
MKNVVNGSEYIEIKQILFTNILGESVKLLQRYEDIAIYQSNYSTIYITRGSDVLSEIYASTEEDTYAADATFTNLLSKEA